VPNSAKRLLVASTEPYSGKSAVVLGIALQLQAQGVDLAFGKPIANTLTSDTPNSPDPDLDFIVSTLALPSSRYYPPVVWLSPTYVEQALGSLEQIAHPSLQSFTLGQGESLLLLEGPGSLTEGTLLNLPLTRMANLIDAAVLLVTRYDSLLLVDRLLAAKTELGDRLQGVIINAVPEAAATAAATGLKPFLEHHGIPVLALLPQSPIMRSITVGEIIDRLHAEVLCCPDRRDLIVESLTIGAMNVNSALRYFRQGVNMAVVTGGDRTDIQLAALETSTQCLVLTGQITPAASILERASDLEVPILAVDSDTLSTVERIDELFGHVGIHEPVKVRCIQELIADHFDLERLLQLLDLRLPVSVS